MAGIAGARTLFLPEQILRSSRSVCANLAEAWQKRRYKGAFIANLNEVKAEAAETQTWLEFAFYVGISMPRRGRNCFGAMGKFWRGRLALLKMLRHGWCRKMSRRSRQHRKRFKCGHRGFGKFCHCCAAKAAVKQAALASRQTKRRQWQARFDQDEIDLKGLPVTIVLKARQVLAALAQGTDYWQLAGKRLNGMRNAIRIPVTRRYRLLCWDDGKTVVPLKVVAHEHYNPLLRDRKRLLSAFLRGSGDG